MALLYEYMSLGRRTDDRLLQPGGDIPRPRQQLVKAEQGALVDLLHVGGEVGVGHDVDGGAGQSRAALTQTTRNSAMAGEF
jgi:hypothetical protein